MFADATVVTAAVLRGSFGCDLLHLAVTRLSEVESDEIEPTTFSAANEMIELWAPALLAPRRRRGCQGGK
jgi:hypothetical protein